MAIHLLFYSSDIRIIRIIILHKNVPLVKKEDHEDGDLFTTCKTFAFLPAFTTNSENQTSLRHDLSSVKWIILASEAQNTINAFLGVRSVGFLYL